MRPHKISYCSLKPNLKKNPGCPNVGNSLAPRPFPLVNFSGQIQQLCCFLELFDKMKTMSTEVYSYIQHVDVENLNL